MGLPTPTQCVSRINDVLEVRQITFEPGEATIDGDARGTLDQMADLLKKCDTVPMEIGGHTDSQGREEMNLQLSQSRAEAVLAALQGRRVPTANLIARGYGEAEPIADNGTEAGREANRRIAFTLLEGEEITTGEGPDDDGTEDDGAADGGDDADAPDEDADDAQDTPEEAQD